MTLPEFHEELPNINSDDGRPFICNGSPLNCNVFIVGINPSTSTSFSKHWHPNDGGFKREGWLETYQEDKSFSNTRERLNIFFDEFKESDAIHLLETNLYNVASPRKDDLADHKKSTEVFNFLLKSIKPEAIIGHGKDTIRYLRHLSGHFYKKGEWHDQVDIFDFSTNMYLRDHLSFHTSFDDCKDIAKRMRLNLEKKLSK